MLSDFDLIIHKFTNEDIVIYPISDVHLGAAEHLKDEWGSFCSTIVEQPNSYVILGGDLINNATRSSVSNIFEETMRPREQKKRMVEMLSPLREKILCAVQGNHEKRSGKDADDDPIYDIMCKLDLEDLYREHTAFVKLQFGSSRDGGQRNPTYTLAVTHGAGGGMLTGGVVNRAERFGYAIDGIDCLVLGHSHKPFTTNPAKIVVDPRHNKVSIKPFKVISMTAWMTYGGYASAKLYNPSSFNPQTLHLCGTRKSLKIMS